MQQRDDQALPWRICIKHFGTTSVVATLLWFWLAYRVTHISAHSTLLLYALSSGWMRPNNVLIWFFPILGGCGASVFIARLTSLSSSWLQARRWFATREELDPPDVIRATEQWEVYLRARVPEAREREATIAFALRDAQFYRHHRQETRSRPRLAQSLSPLLRTRHKLTDRQMLLALNERACFERLRSCS